MFNYSYEVPLVFIYFAKRLKGVDFAPHPSYLIMESSHVT